jgi:hypothetical protein
MAPTTLHIVFNPSAAAGLRDALKEDGRDDRVICLFDCLSFGPINPPDRKVRAAWVEDQLGYTDWEEVAGSSDSFWREALAPHDRKIAWLSRRSTQEYAGFLECLWRLADGPCELVDLTDVEVVGRDKDGKPTTPHLAISLAMLPPYEILENRLLDRAEKLTPALRERYRELWIRLRSENAALRVFSGDEFVSAPIDFFDPLLLSHAKADWQKAAMVIAKSLNDFWNTSFIQTGDLVLAARLRALADAGSLESQGDLLQIRRSEVRLPRGITSSY